MWIIGGGIMLGGLVGSALFGNITTALVSFAIGGAIIKLASWYKELREQATRQVPYPSYKY